MNPPGWLTDALAAHQSWTLDEAYRAACTTPHDINEHMPTLRRLGSVCLHVTEMGTRYGASLLALLHCGARRVVAYDLHVPPTIGRLWTFAAAAGVDFRFVRGNTLEETIEPTELLLIDTFHTYGQLRVELERHAPRVLRYIALHDTATFGLTGEDGRTPGLMRAVEEFLANNRGRWTTLAHRTNNNGLTVLRRIDG